MDLSADDRQEVPFDLMTYGHRCALLTAGASRSQAVQDHLLECIPRIHAPPIIATLIEPAEAPAPAALKRLQEAVAGTTPGRSLDWVAAVRFTKPQRPEPSLAPVRGGGGAIREQPFRGDSRAEPQWSAIGGIERNVGVSRHVGWAKEGGGLSSVPSLGLNFWGFFRRVRLALA